MIKNLSIIVQNVEKNKTKQLLRNDNITKNFIKQQKVTISKILRKLNQNNSYKNNYQFKKINVTNTKQLYKKVSKTRTFQSQQVIAKE